MKISWRCVLQTETACKSQRSVWAKV